MSFILGSLTPFAVERYAPHLFQVVDDKRGVSALYTAAEWPKPGCFTPTAAVMAPAVSAATYLSEKGSLNPDSMIESGIAVVGNKGTLGITLSASQPGETLLVRKIEGVVYKHQPAPAQWSAQRPLQSACGSPQRREFALGLSGGRATDLEDSGIVGGMYGVATPTEIPDEELGDEFTITQIDFAKVEIDVSTSDGYYEFGITISYVLDGRELSETLGTEDEPYKLYGGNSLTSYYEDGTEVSTP